MLLEAKNLTHLRWAQAESLRSNQQRIQKRILRSQLQIIPLILDLPANNPNKTSAPYRKHHFRIKNQNH